MSASSPETLLRHDAFVRGLLRELLADEERARDIAQETWLRFLRRPPRDATSVRGWLRRVATNLARDEHRGRGRREERERAAARPEAVEAVDESQAVLETHRQVVDAVLELREPYREVVLLHSFRGWSIARIAGRSGRSTATVRSQLSRAHALLREELDRRNAGDRSAWAAIAFAPLPGRATLLGLSRSMQAAIALLLAGGGGAWLVLGPRPKPIEPATVRVPLPPTANSAPGGPALVELSGPEGREALAPLAKPAASTSNSAQDVDLDAMSPLELRALAVQIQHALEPLLLVPDARLVEENRDLLALPDTGICRLLRNDRVDEGLVDLAPMRGGGAYYSFASREHSYNAEPDISFQGGELRSGFHGGQWGLILEIGDIDLAAVPTDDSQAPPELPEARLASWRLLWQDWTESLREVEVEQRTERSDLLRSRRPQSAGSTYLLRSASADEHDHLVALRVLAIDDLGCTLAWRILRRWPVRDEGSGHRPTAGDAPPVPPPPAWLGGLGFQELVDLLRDLRAQASRRLLTVPEELQRRHAELVGQAPTSYGARSGFARILERFEWGALIGLREAGAYYSFLTGSNDFARQPDLGLESGSFQSGFAGVDVGWLLDLGDIPFAELGSVLAGTPPSRLDQQGRAAWDFLGRVRASGAGRDRSIDRADADSALELGVSDRVRAIVGHTYLLRAVRFDSHDHLVVFTVIDGDEAGLSLVYNVLASWPVHGRGR